MFCKKCGKLIEAGKEYCDICAESIEKNASEPKVWSVFAKIGYISGLVSFIAAFATLGIFGFVIGPEAIIFSILGKKSSLYADKANKGLVFGILGTVLGFLVYTITLFVITLMSGAY